MTADFRQRLIELLSSYEGSDAELAKKMGVSKQTISAWRSGTRSPKRPTIESLARYFNVNTAWLMGLDVDRSADPDEELFELREQLRRDPEIRELFGLAKNATPAEIRAATAMLKSFQHDQRDYYPDEDPNA
ncbi:MAG: helix-turn-helix transcriptional regulator [Verrucomicrobia bacterium]|nr:helix-turn-helix transcriptional regulator [Verrucomicrobiota bacterium]